MRLALLFPGQGVQHPAMLRWLDDAPDAAPALAAMVGRIGADWRSRLADPAWASTNAVAQCLVTGTSLAAWQALRAHLPRPVAIAGYSVGELAAFAAAGVFALRQAIDIAALRADAMDRAAAGAPGGLASVIGPLAAAIDAVCRECGTEVAIRIAPDRVVLGGSAEALAAALHALSSGGAEVTRLPVQVASHTRCMRAAALDIARQLAPLDWQPPITALVTGRDGRAVRQVDALKQALAEQTAHAVEWQVAQSTLAERRPDRVLEVGAGTSLSRIWRIAQPDIPVRSADEFGSVAAIVDWSLGA